MSGEENEALETPTAEVASARKIAVLGAGFAGLRAATILAREGHDVEVYEARSAVGGRARGEWCAGHWMDGAWPVLGARDAAAFFSSGACLVIFEAPSAAKYKKR